jgi:hypothetical protein
MRLHWKPNAPREGQRSRPAVRYSRPDDGVTFSSPVREDPGWVLLVKTTVLAATVFKALA